MRQFAAITAFLLVAAGPPQFKMQEFETTLKVGYGVVIEDVNGDGKPDIVVADARRVLWYENPTWKRHTIIEGVVPPDNVCIAPHDIDGDGKIDFFLGAGWQPTNTKSGGTIHWLRRGKTLDEPWQVFDIGTEPTVHRMRVAKFDLSGKPELLVAPLQGRDSSAKGNWVDGRPVRLLTYNIPKDPVKSPWIPRVFDESLHVVHNIWPTPGLHYCSLLACSYEGIFTFDAARHGGTMKTKIHEANQSRRDGSRGASEIKLGKLKNGREHIATIEPWHGDQVVAYTEKADQTWDRQVIDDKLKWGHAVWCADLDGDGNDEIIVGVRDDLSKTPGERRGVRVYSTTDGKAWTKRVIDDGVATEDLIAADLDGDGRIDIVAVGRATGNGRIYWNRP